VPEIIRQLIYIQSNYGTNAQVLAKNIRENKYKIENLSEFNHRQLFERLKIFRRRAVEGEDLLNGEYVLTTDNYLKMNVIYLRVQAKVPVIIMGETGCGKTSLIRFFC
jgi:ABC-type uncharacterized transport system fused permease/ATPase subunit